MGLTIVKAVTKSPEKLAEYEKRNADLMASIRLSRPDIVRSGMVGFGILIALCTTCFMVLGLPSKQKLQHLEDQLYKRQIAKKEADPLQYIKETSANLLPNSTPSTVKKE